MSAGAVPHRDQLPLAAWVGVLVGAAIMLTPLLWTLLLSFKVNAALVEQWTVMLADVTEQARHLSHLMFGGKPLGIEDLSGLTERWMAHGTRMITRTMDTRGLALAPVHEQATANARRLS